MYLAQEVHFRMILGLFNPLLSQRGGVLSRVSSHVIIIIIVMVMVMVRCFRVPAYYYYHYYNYHYYYHYYCMARFLLLLFPERLWMRLNRLPTHLQ